MARALPVEEFELCYKVDFNTVIRGYQRCGTVVAPNNHIASMTREKRL